VSSIVLKELVRECGSHSQDHDVQDYDYSSGARERGSGARGDMNRDPIYDAEGS
jgi:hypothetical protein